MPKLRRFALIFVLCSLGATPFTVQAADVPVATQANSYAYSFTSIDGKSLPLFRFKGKVLLIVNTASQCGFTPQYEGLQQLWEKYKDRGLVVIGVPSNNFGGQEPGTEKDIQAFTTKTFKITFPLTAKAETTGDDAHPFFKYVKRELGFMAAPKWNFYKYLIDKNGKLVDYFPSTTSPMSEEITEAIEKLLPPAK